MPRNPLTNPQPGDVLIRTVGRRTHRIEVTEINSGSVHATHQGRNGISQKDFTLHRWCNDLAGWTVQTVADHDGPSRDARSEPERGDLLERSDLTHDQRRKVLGTTSTSLPGGKTHTEVQFHILREPDPIFDSCSLQDWWRWTGRAITVEPLPASK